MSNTIKVPHTVTFEAIINIDTVPASILPALLACSEEMLMQMCKEATVHALAMSNVLPLANEGNSWAEITIKEGN